MTDKSQAITTLKKFYGDRFYEIDVNSAREELINANDRSVIISIAAQCDSALDVVVGRTMPFLRRANAKEYENAFRFGGPLGSFSAKIELAFYLEQIDATLRDQLDDLRNIRNAVAHTRRHVTFADAQLQNAARRLFHPRGMYRLLSETPDGFRRTFVAEGMLIFNMLAFGRDEAIAATRDVFTKNGQAAPF